MAPPSKPGKRRKITVLEAVIMVGGVLAIIGYNRINIVRFQRSLPNVNTRIVGEWKAERGPEHLVFRSDDSVSLMLPGHAADGNAATPADTIGPPPVTGKYKITQQGKIYLELMNGKKYSTTISPINPNRFDLIDSETDGVTTYDRVSVPPATGGTAAPAAAPTSAEAPPAAEAPAVLEAPSTAAAPSSPEAEAPPVPEAPSTSEAPAAPKKKHR